VLQIAPTLPAGILDVLYADPPFFTKREQVGGAASQAGAARLRFKDWWEGGRREYLEWLRERVVAIRRLLKPGGVFLLHLDWHAVHYAKVMCDQVFEGEDGEESGGESGGGRFENELIWYYQTGGASKGRFSRKHDTILMYSNGGGRGVDFYFDGEAIAIPRTAKAMKRARCPTGARIAVTDTHKNPDDVLLVPALNPMANERTGYPTQKPVELLERLLKALCPPAGTVGDFFCGSGTTLVAAQRLGRKWVGADASAAAVEIARQRVAEVATADAESSTN
jgi:DNA modification methylase